MTITVRLYGGLGNQMFQYAVGRCVSILNKTTLQLDVSYFDQQTYSILRSYGLSCFNILQQFAQKDELEAIHSTSDDNTRLGWLQKYLKQIFGDSTQKTVSNLSPVLIRRESSYRFDPCVLDLKGNIYLDGYWQSEKYFLPIENLLRRELTVRYPAHEKYRCLIEFAQSLDSISLHMRRGDYVSHPSAKNLHGLCSLDYYCQALELINQNALITNPHVFVFSDDINWVKQNLKYDIPLTFVDSIPHCEFEDLRLMRNCKHNIIANSSFSWWGAWLNENPNKIVICPDPWFDQLDWDTQDLIPASWIKLSR